MLHPCFNFLCFVYLFLRIIKFIYLILVSKNILYLLQCKAQSFWRPLHTVCSWTPKKMTLALYLLHIPLFWKQISKSDSVQNLMHSSALLLLCLLTSRVDSADAGFHCIVLQGLFLNYQYSNFHYSLFWLYCKMYTL